MGVGFLQRTEDDEKFVMAFNHKEVTCSIRTAAPGVRLWDIRISQIVLRSPLLNRKIPGAR